MVMENEIKSPTPQRQSSLTESGQTMETLFSPRLKSLAAMAGWDEESILVATLIVEDTPDRQFKHKRRSSDSNLKSPPSNSSKRKRRSLRKSPISVPVINLDEEQPANPEIKKEKHEMKSEVEEESNVDEVESSKHDSGVSCSETVLPCMDKLKEELSCAICLEICFEPSTTSCGHSFCKKCLRSVAEKCGKKCPKCRQLISNARSCTVNTVLWNTIQLLFPHEVEARKAAGASITREEPSQKLSSPSEEGTSARRSWRRTRAARTENFRDEIWQLSSSDESGRSRRENLSRILERRRRRGTLSQDEDAALALRLHREEFMGAFRGNNSDSRLFH